MRGDSPRPLTERPAFVSAPAVELIPQKHGGALRRGNPGHRGRPPSWIREQLREGLVQALPMIRYALRTGKDKRTGHNLGVADLTRIIEVAAKISMPAQSELELGAMDSPPFVVQLRTADQMRAEDERIEEPPPLAITARVVTAPDAIDDSRATTRAILPPPPHRSAFGPGVGS